MTAIYHLYDADTAELIGPATPAQIEASYAEEAGETGTILVDVDSGDVIDDGTWAAQQPSVRTVYVA